MLINLYDLRTHYKEPMYDHNTSSKTWKMVAHMNKVIEPTVIMTNQWARAKFGMTWVYRGLNHFDIDEAIVAYAEKVRICHPRWKSRLTANLKEMKDVARDIQSGRDKESCKAS